MSPYRTGSVRPAKVCFLCGAPVVSDGSREHFVPRCFYDGGRLPSERGLTLLAHRKCNGSTAEDEQWVATNLALSNPMGWRDRSHWDRAIRTLAKPEASGMRSRIIDDAAEVPGGMLLPLGTRRVVWVIAKIVKGLCYRDRGILLGPDTEWSVRWGNYQDFIASDASYFAEVPAKGDISQRGSVLLAKGDGLRETRYCNWQLVIRGQHVFFVTAVPRVKLGALDGPNDCLRLVWPKRRQTDGDE